MSKTKTKCISDRLTLKLVESTLEYGLPRLNGKECTCQQRRRRRCGFQSLGRGHPLEEEMVSQSCILPWEIPWTEKPGELQSVGLQKCWTPLTTRACMLVFTLADKYKNFYNALDFSLNTFTFRECSSHHCLF